jgi:ACT domain-containing protein
MEYLVNYGQDFALKRKGGVLLDCESDFVPLSNAVEILGVSQSTLYKYENVGLIKAYRTVGGHRRSSLDELSLFLEKMRNGDFSNFVAQK